MFDSSIPASGLRMDLVAWWGIALVLAVGVVWLVRWARRSGRRRHVVIANLGVLCALLGVTFAIGETYLRYGFDSTTWHASTWVSRAWFGRHVAMNHHGCRDAEFARSSSPTARPIVFLGDSFTFGYGVADPADRFSDRVKARLRGGTAPVWNAARIGASTGDELGALDAVFALGGVGHLVLVYAPNDIEDLAEQTPDAALVARGLSSDSLFDRSFLLDLVSLRWSLYRSGAGASSFDALRESYADPVTSAAQRERLAAIASRCVRGGARLHVVVLPSFAVWGDDYPLHAAHELVSSTFEPLGVDVLDMRDAYAEFDGSDLVVGAFDAHPNELAHEIAADAIFEAFFAPR